MKIRKVKSLVYDKSGKEIRLYPIGDLAEKLGRKTQTIRKWIKLGILPEAQFRDKLNQRFYLEGEIELIARLAKECDIRQGQEFRITGFQNRVLEGIVKFRKEWKEQVKK